MLVDVVVEVEVVTVVDGGDDLDFCLDLRAIHCNQLRAPSSESEVSMSDKDKFSYLRQSSMREI